LDEQGHTASTPEGGMLLEPLCDVIWTYDLIRSVEPSPRGDGRLFGQGTAAFTGRLAGQARWSNSPRLRGGYAFPNAHGVLDVEVGGSVLFRLTGMSSLTDGRGIHVLTFETGDDEHAWLNDAFALGEGSVDAARGALAMRYYTCTVDYLPGVPPVGD
jgi:hypothetical protein